MCDSRSLRAPATATEDRPAPGSAMAPGQSTASCRRLLFLDLPQLPNHGIADVIISRKLASSGGWGQGPTPQVGGNPACGVVPPRGGAPGLASPSWGVASLRPSHHTLGRRRQWDEKNFFGHANTVRLKSCVAARLFSSVVVILRSLGPIRRGLPTRHRFALPTGYWSKLVKHEQLIVLWTTESVTTEVLIGSILSCLSLLPKISCRTALKCPLYASALSRTQFCELLKLRAFTNTAPFGVFHHHFANGTQNLRNNID
jgi:hypothetical protein